MSILIGVAVFLVWYLVGLLTVMVLAGTRGQDWGRMSRADTYILLFLSIFGFVGWTIGLICAEIDERTT